MAFQIKDALSIVAGMVNHMRAVSEKLTDFRIGSVARTIVEGPAIEIDALYQNMVRGLSEAIPTACYTAFAFERLTALPAVGRVTFTIPAPLGVDTLIPAGTSVQRADGLATYVTSADATILTGNTTVNASITATVPGPLGNAGAGTVTTVTSGPPGVTVTNAAPIAGGTEDETDEQRAVRFLQYLDTLSRGPVATLEDAARKVVLYDDDGSVLERVVFARVLELWRVAAGPPGFVDVYLFNGGVGASVDLIEAVQEKLDGYTDGGDRIPGWKAAGIVVKVFAAELRDVDVTLTVKGDLSAAEEAAVEDAVTAVIDNTQVGAPVYRAELIAAVMAIDNVVNCIISVPPGDVIPNIKEKAVTGTVLLTVVP